MLGRFRFDRTFKYSYDKEDTTALIGLVVSASNFQMKNKEEKGGEEEEEAEEEEEETGRWANTECLKVSHDTIMTSPKLI